MAWGGELSGEKMSWESGASIGLYSGVQRWARLTPSALPSASHPPVLAATPPPPSATPDATHLLVLTRMLHPRRILHALTVHFFRPPHVISVQFLARSVANLAAEAEWQNYTEKLQYSPVCERLIRNSMAAAFLQLLRGGEPACRDLLKMAHIAMDLAA